MIPKVIHYCWFGGNPLPKSVKECIKTWKEKCPDYKIIEWNESNFDVNSHPFIKAAYEAKAWAFVSDYARLKVVYENGGFYLDTDVELLKNLDFLCENKCYFGIEQDLCMVASGLGFGAEKENNIILDMLKEYDKVDFTNEEREKIACPILNTKALETKGFIKENKFQNLGDVTVYPSEYFDPIAPGDTQNLLTEKTISIHHYSATWTSSGNRIKRKIINTFGQENMNKVKCGLRKVKNASKEYFSLQKLIIYLSLFPFFHPVGFSVYSEQYHDFFVYWLLAVCVSVFAYVGINLVKRKHSSKIFNKSLISLFIYQAIFILITFVTQQGIGEGLQKLFVVPVFGLLCAILLVNCRNDFLNCISDILIVEFCLSLFVFNRLFFPNLFSGELGVLFTGHIQTASQLALIGIFVSVIIVNFYDKSSGKAKLLVVLSMLLMLQSKTLASYITIAILIFAYIIFKTGFSKKAFLLDTKIYLSGWFLINIFMVFIYKYVIALPFLRQYQLSLSARTLIWQEIMKLVCKKPVLGYGAYGVKVVLPWHTATGIDGMNYAHNELLQKLLDGGIVLLVAFVILLVIYTENINQLKNNKQKYIANVFLGMFLLLMVIESVTEYYYIFVFLSILAYLPQDSLQKIRGRKSGRYFN